DEDLALGSRVPQERLRPAPAADLQEVLAEHALEHSARQPLLVRKTTAAERRREPVAERLEPAVIAVGHASILAAPPGGRARALPSVRARVGPLSPNRDSQYPATKRASRFWDMRRLPPQGRSVRFGAMHAKNTGGSTPEDQHPHRSICRGLSRAQSTEGGSAAAAATAARRGPAERASAT